MKLAKAIQLLGGGTPKTSCSSFWGGDIPWLSVADFSNSRKYVYTTEKTITNDGLLNCSTKLLEAGDIILSARGTVGSIAVLKRPMTFNQSCYGIRGIERVSDTSFIYYIIKHTVSELQQISHGGVFDTITRETFENILIRLPPLPEQKAIAAVLSSLDDKIDLLHRQNATLEAMAEALFRQWFVVEAKDEWEEKPLLHYVKLIGGGTPKTSVKGYWGGRIPWLSGGDIAGAHKSFVLNSEKTISEDGINNSSAKLLPKFATILTARGTVGKFCLLGTSMAYSQTNYGILPADDESYFFTFLLVDHLIKELQMAAYGSVFDTITTQTFEEVKLALPSVDDILKFEGQVTSFFSKMFANQTQIRTLEKLRDTLLPKLMSGEVRVDF